MKSGSAFAAVDLGAESGRVVLGRLAGGKISLQEVRRFANRPVELPDGLHWDIVELFCESRSGLGVAAREYGAVSVGVDTWGVDYGLLDESGRLLGIPFHYRDRRTDGSVERHAAVMGRAQAYETTGIRQMPINTVYQLLAEAGSAALTGAESLALIPDLLAFWLSGQQTNERTVASTTGLLEARTGEWALGLVKALGLPGRMFGGLVDPGTVIGPLLGAQADVLGLEAEVSVIASAGHDTAAAFAGAPVNGRSAAILSSGTWSLLGTELDGPVLTHAAQKAGLSNERGVCGTIRLLRNVMGLWLLQQCRAEWTENGGAPSYEELTRRAAESRDEPSLFDPDHPSLLYPGDMPLRIEKLVRETGQRPPQDRGALVKSIVVSLACKYRRVLESLEQATGRSIGTIHIVGGGSKNALLCQLTADITGRDVLAGPAEATALGNILVQACALGHLSGFEEMRQVARASFPPVAYHPARPAGAAGAATAVAGEATYGRFLAVTGLTTKDEYAESQHSPQPQGRTK